ncbi:MAG: hypothetical protein K8R58_04385 [Bacteroidales bacterium]|nr:hypothetical protein [Bacteroidales bacterium]
MKIKSESNAGKTTIITTATATFIPYGFASLHFLLLSLFKPKYLTI